MASQMADTHALDADPTPPAPDARPTPQAPAPLDPMQQWDDDFVFKTYLKNHIDPVREVKDRALYKVHAAVLKVRIRELEKMRAMVAPRRSGEVDKELALVLFKRKVSAWMAFPISDLPREILANIFRYVVWSSNGAAEATQHRLNLTWVNRLWRSVAIGDQTLWNSVWFRDPPPWTRSLIFLERAGTCPLDIRINEREKKAGDTEAPPKMTVAEIDYLLDIILKKVTQIRIVVIVLDDEKPTVRVLERFRDSGPLVSLERFEIHRTGPPWLWAQPHGSDPIALANGNVPKLKWLCLNGLSIDWYKLPLTNLRTIDLRRLSSMASPSRDRWREILGNTPLLFKVAMDAAGPQMPEGRYTYRPPVKLPHVRDLLLGDVRLEYAKYLLSFIDAPGVMNLALINLQGEDFGPLFEVLIGRFPNTKLLSVYIVQIAPHMGNLKTMVQWLESMPNLKFLKILQGRSTLLNAFLQDPRAFRKPPPEGEPRQPNGADVRPVLCPKMNLLHFQQQEPAPFVNFTKGRLQLGVPFTRAYVPNTDYSTMAPEFSDAVRHNVQSLYVTTGMMMTPEEDEIYTEMDNSVTPPMIKI